MNKMEKSLSAKIDLETIQNKNELLERFTFPKIFLNSGNLTLPDVSIECATDLGIIYEALQKNSSIPSSFISEVLVPMFDSTGKLHPGFLTGAFTLWGYPPECLRIDYKFPWSDRHFIGSYSRVFLNIQFEDGSVSQNCDYRYNQFIGIDYCVPKSCGDDQQMITLMKSIIKVSGENGTSHSPVCNAENLDDQKYELKYQGYIVIVFMGIILGIGILAALVDYFLLPEDSINRKIPSIQLFLSFSLYQNIKEIFHVGSSNKQGQIGPIHCIRFFSICWVVLGHSFSLASSFLNNVLDLMLIIKQLPTQFLVNAYFSVDSFFFISGVLLAFIWFKEFKKDKRKVMSVQGWVLFYVHRIARLTPPYYIAVVFYTYVFHSMTSNMPVYLIQGIDEASPVLYCQRNWWTNFLFINNLVHWKEQCFGQGWYVATDMQMFIFSPLLLISLSIHPLAGIGVASALFFGSSAANIFTLYKNHYPASPYVTGPIDPMWEEDPDDLRSYQLLMYDAVWIRCQIYIMGILVGYLLQMKPKMKINKYPEDGLQIYLKPILKELVKKEVPEQDQFKII
uniref:Nose resistant-to-fluoxetine protein N-terminal domain-containing protein n=1 Tax=Acrobeloides nanus TaxID=290746 RepID=A0A914EAV5_9BILA